MTLETAGPVRLYLMQVGYLPADHLPVVCFLVQMNDGTHVLIDSGLPPADQLPPDLKAEVAADVIEQLAVLGLQPGDIDLLICTHFDIDHAGRHGDFPNARYVVQRRHYEDARINPRFAAVRSQWDHPVARYQFVEGGVQLRPGLHLLDTDGHVTGHQSVLVYLPQTGPVLLTIDAVFNEASFTREQVSASTHKLLDLVEREDIRLVIFGHDMHQWQSLRTLPAYYD